MSTNDPSGWEDFLEPGETLLWQGRPSSRIIWSDLEPESLVSGLIFGGFAIFWTANALSTAAGSGLQGLLLPLAGLFCVGLGGKIAGGDVILDAYRRSNSWYSLTDRRAFIATKLRGKRQLQTFPITDQSALVLEDGTPGSVYFAKSDGKASKRIGFRQIEEARAVYDMMRQVARGQL